MTYLIISSINTTKESKKVVNKMKLSTRSRYGARLMFELALNYNNDLIFLKDIAKRQGVSEKYLSKLIIPLRGAGFVNTVRGAHGGYIIAKDPKEITMRQIVEILEGDITPVECIKDKNICGRRNCPTKFVWDEVYRVILNTLDNITLADVVECYKNNIDNFIDYNI